MNDTDPTRAARLMRDMMPSDRLRLIVFGVLAGKVAVLRQPVR